MEGSLKQEATFGDSEETRLSLETVNRILKTLKKINDFFNIQQAIEAGNKRAAAFTGIQSMQEVRIEVEKLWHDLEELNSSHPLRKSMSMHSCESKDGWLSTKADLISRIEKSAYPNWPSDDLQLSLYSEVSITMTMENIIHLIKGEKVEPRQKEKKTTMKPPDLQKLISEISQLKGRLEGLVGKFEKPSNYRGETGSQKVYSTDDSDLERVKSHHKFAGKPGDSVLADVKSQHPSAKGGKDVQRRVTNEEKERDSDTDWHKVARTSHHSEKEKKKKVKRSKSDVSLLGYSSNGRPSEHFRSQKQRKKVQRSKSDPVRVKDSSEKSHPKLNYDSYYNQKERKKVHRGMFGSDSARVQDSSAKSHPELDSNLHVSLKPKATVLQNAEVERLKKERQGLIQELEFDKSKLNKTGDGAVVEPSATQGLQTTTDSLTIKDETQVQFTKEEDPLIDAEKISSIKTMDAERIGSSGGVISTADCRIAIPSDTIPRPIIMRASTSFPVKDPPESMIPVSPCLELFPDMDLTGHADIELQTWVAPVDQYVEGFVYFKENEHSPWSDPKKLRIEQNRKAKFSITRFCKYSVFVKIGQLFKVNFCVRSVLLFKNETRMITCRFIGNCKTSLKQLGKEMRGMERVCTGDRNLKVQFGDQIKVYLSRPDPKVQMKIPPKVEVNEEMLVHWSHESTNFLLPDNVLGKLEFKHSLHQYRKEKHLKELVNHRDRIVIRPRTQSTHQTFRFDSPTINGDLYAGNDRTHVNRSCHTGGGHTGGGPTGGGPTGGGPTGGGPTGGGPTGGGPTGGGPTGGGPCHCG